MGCDNSKTFAILDSKTFSYPVKQNNFQFLLSRIAKHCYRKKRWYLLSDFTAFLRVLTFLFSWHIFVQIPFIGLQLVSVSSCLIFPWISLWFSPRPFLLLFLNLVYDELTMCQPPTQALFPRPPSSHPPADLQVPPP